MSVKWDKVGAIASILALFVAVTTPEIRCRIGLGCSPEASSSPTQTSNDSSKIPTPSDVDANYSKLQDLLASKRFKEADQETTRLMLWIARHGEQDGFSIQDIEEFPCTDLRTADQLWVRYSNGRFGFSVQNRIWQEVGRDPDKFGGRVGWQNEYNNLSFDLRAPLGELPTAFKKNWREQRTPLRSSDSLSHLTPTISPVLMFSSLEQKLAKCSIP